LIGRNKIFGDGIGDDGVDDRFSFSVEEFRLIDVFILIVIIIWKLRTPLYLGFTCPFIGFRYFSDIMKEASI